MSRKDTILVAVLVNAGLLVVLFVSALKNEPAPRVDMASLEMPPSVTKVQVPKVVQPKVEKPTPVKVTAPPPVRKPQPEKKIVQAQPVVVVKKVDTKAALVQKGDSLDKIAKIHGVSVSELMSVNNLSSTNLQIGQRLKLPEKSKKVDVQYYIVKEGDNPWTIAQKHKMKTADLLKLNDMDDQKAKKIRPGHKLRVR